MINTLTDVLGQDLTGSTWNLGGAGIVGVTGQSVNITLPTGASTSGSSWLDTLNSILPNTVSAILTPSSGPGSGILSGPLHVSDLWRFLVALLLFVLISHAIPGDSGIFWGILILIGAMAINSTSAAKLINGVVQYLQGGPYIP